MVSTQKTVTDVKAGVTDANVSRACEVAGHWGARQPDNPRLERLRLLPAPASGALEMRGHPSAIWEEERALFKGGQWLLFLLFLHRAQQTVPKDGKTLPLSRLF